MNKIQNKTYKLLVFATLSIFNIADNANSSIYSELKYKKMQSSLSMNPTIQPMQSMRQTTIQPIKITSINEIQIETADKKLERLRQEEEKKGYSQIEKSIFPSISEGSINNIIQDIDMQSKLINQNQIINTIQDIEIISKLINQIQTTNIIQNIDMLQTKLINQIQDTNTAQIRNLVKMILIRFNLLKKIVTSDIENSKESQYGLQFLLENLDKINQTIIKTARVNMIDQTSKNNLINGIRDLNTAVKNIIGYKQNKSTKILDDTKKKKPNKTSSKVSSLRLSDRKPSLAKKTKVTKQKIKKKESSSEVQTEIRDETLDYTYKTDWNKIVTNLENMLNFNPTPNIGLFINSLNEGWMSEYCANTNAIKNILDSLDYTLYGNDANLLNNLIDTIQNILGLCDRNLNFNIIQPYTEGISKTSKIIELINRMIDLNHIIEVTNNLSSSSIQRLS